MRRDAVQAGTQFSPSTFAQFCAHQKNTDEEVKLFA